MKYSSSLAAKTLIDPVEQPTQNHRPHTQVEENNGIFVPGFQESGRYQGKDNGCGYGHAHFSGDGVSGSHQLQCGFFLIHHAWDENSAQNYGGDDQYFLCSQHRAPFKVLEMGSNIASLGKILKSCYVPVSLVVSKTNITLGVLTPMCNESFLSVDNRNPILYI
jgi:hypothetical protein